jgi:GNAT superfamily N-acetyltransferase
VNSELIVQALTPERWPDLCRLFGPNGAVAGCWCMWWRQPSSEFEQKSGDANRYELRSLVDGGQETGLVAYLGDEPVGWISVAPRSDFGRLQRSPVLKPLDGEPAWAIVCFYIHRRHRRRGVGAALLRAAVQHAVSRGAQVIEGFPVDSRGGKVNSSSAFTGIPSMFLEAGFQEVARRSPTRPIMRYAVR